MTKQLVLGQKALAASVVPSFPGERHPGLLLAYGVPLPSGDVYQVEGLLKQQLRQLLEQGVSQQELSKVKKSSLAGLYGLVRSNSTLAAALCSYHASTGGWRGLLRELELVQGLEAQQLLRVARRTFRDDNCFAGYMLPLKA
jgi:predicted Zn-dependent peptidase